MTTIYDIAKETGYSAPTVSKALNGSPEVSERTRERIVDAAKRMGYTPNAMAKALSTKKSYLIGIIYDDLYMLRGMEHPLFAGIIDAFKSRIEVAGYELIFLSRQLGPRKLNYLDHARMRHIDGVYIVNTSLGDTGMDELVAGDLPCVSANDPFPGVPRVVSENYQGARTAVAALCDMGHRRIAHLSGPITEKSPAGLERRSGYLDELSARGIKAEPELTVECAYWHAEAGRQAMNALLDSGASPSAVFAACDTIAYGAMAAARDRGLSVPGDISFVGFDDYEVSAYLTPSLTTIRQDRVRLGTEAAELMLRILSGEDIRPESVPRVATQLIARDSAASL
ncbi:MAG: LacI family DNA-binding transcriptional regulator [Spirochaetales bacterium]|nr:LacI family DNA-binding transcriptional regulator [Spirochaetales bacterium]MBP7262841.1 LacI family DNA-binding transcriptional regulator [Spirochaetia bacterium]